MLGGGEMVAVENPDSVARKQRGQGGDHRRDDRLQPFCRGADQRGREDRFEVVEFVVDRLDRHADGLGAGVKGGVDGGVDAVNNQAHQVDDRGEKESACILSFSDILKQLVHGLRRERVFQKGPNHDRDGAVLGKSLENVIEQHQGRLPAKLVTPWKATA